MRIESTNERMRLWGHLVKATDEWPISKALDDARYYLRMRGKIGERSRGRIERLLRAAEECGSRTAPETADVLDTHELPVHYETIVQIGEGDT